MWPILLWPTAGPTLNGCAPTVTSPRHQIWCIPISMLLKHVPTSPQLQLETCIVLLSYIHKFTFTWKCLILSYKSMIDVLFDLVQKHFFHSKVQKYTPIIRFHPTSHFVWRNSRIVFSVFGRQILPVPHESHTALTSVRNSSSVDLACILKYNLMKLLEYKQRAVKSLLLEWQEVSFFQT